MEPTVSSRENFIMLAHLRFMAVRGSFISCVCFYPFPTTFYTHPRGTLFSFNATRIDGRASFVGHARSARRVYSPCSQFPCRLALVWKNWEIAHWMPLPVSLTNAHPGDSAGKHCVTSRNSALGASTICFWSHVFWNELAVLFPPGSKVSDFSLCLLSDHFDSNPNCSHMGISDTCCFVLCKWQTFSMWFHMCEGCFSPAFRLWARVCVKFFAIFNSNLLKNSFVFLKYWVLWMIHLFVCVCIYCYEFWPGRRAIGRSH